MFITFEGIDFCGKSTQVELLKNYLIEKNRIVEIIREPGGTNISEEVRNILLDKKNGNMFMETEFLLFSASRSQLVREKIRPYLGKGFYVISDRFHDSSVAYQGYGRGISIEAVSNVNSLAIGSTIPDITFFIDIPVEEAEKRKTGKSVTDLDRIEISEMNFYERVRNGYLEISKTEKRFRIMDGRKSIEEIHKNIIREIILLENKESV
ncbi:MAG: dTMP kinase [Ignavibacteriaceae bacterium]